jgi:transmembrane sensor
MEKEQLQELFKKYHSGKCTEEEKALLEAWYLQFNEHEIEVTPQRIKGIGRKIFYELPGNESDFVITGLKLAAAAVTIGIMVTIGLNTFMPDKDQKNSNAVAEIVPGSDRAVLTLSNGKMIELDKISNGQITAESGHRIYKSTTGQVVYSESQSDKTDTKTALNNISTPKGGQWQVILPDGSKVWLNSSSSLDFPTSFQNQQNRTVKLHGEGYFEVAKDKKHPFIVKTDRQEVTVLGTHFNINSYDDEPSVRTTLAEGRIKILSNDGAERILLPGQEASQSQNRLTVGDADLEETLAWKNGYFRFNDEKIQSVMRKLARWYNIEVKYISDTPNDSLNGKISRSKNIEQVLKALEATKTVHFKVEGRRVTVMK